MFGFLFHMYYVLIPARCRCKTVENVAKIAHSKLNEHAPGFTKNILGNTNHRYVDHHEVVYASNSASTTADDDKSDRLERPVTLEMASITEEKEAVATVIDDEKEVMASIVEGKNTDNNQPKQVVEEVVEGKNDSIKIKVAASNDGDIIVDM